ncbi:MAG TPA: hypothetical protein DCZ69_17690, partial [Syntrophobacteraceae bacterium]|nr:hypothetical protein [Syntrophobacteraceae bacterium]
MRSVTKLVRSMPAVALVVSLLISVLVIALRSAGYLESLELAAYDWAVRLLPKIATADSRIVLIG